MKLDFNQLNRQLHKSFIQLHRRIQRESTPLSIEARNDLEKKLIFELISGITMNNQGNLDLKELVIASLDDIWDRIEPTRTVSLYDINNPNHFRQIIAFFCRKVCYSKQKTAFAIFYANHSKNYYVQISKGKRKNYLYCEVVSNKYLAVTDRISENQISLLSKIGWKLDEEIAYIESRLTSKNDSLDISQIILKTLIEVFKMETKKLDIELLN